MRQSFGKTQTITSGTADPTGSEGIDMSMFSGVAKVKKYLAKVEVGGTGSAIVALWGKDPDPHNEWAPAGNNDGNFNNGAAIAAGQKRFFVVENAGVFARLAGKHVVSSGAPTVTIDVTEIPERGD